MKSKNQSRMMFFYKSMWTFIVMAALPGDLSTLSALALPMAITTFVYMFLAAKESMGKPYALKNLIIGSILAFAFGLGFILWPILVNSEIIKRGEIKEVREKEKPQNVNIEANDAPVRIARKGGEAKEMDVPAIKLALINGDLSADDLYWDEGLDDWIPLHAHPRFENARLS